jgi:F-type H+-transporting ATPase subunit beta
VDPLESNSNMLNQNIISKEHYECAKNVKQVLTNYDELKYIIAMLGIEELSMKDRLIVTRARKIEKFLTQPFFTTSHFTGMPGVFVPIEKTIEGCDRIMSGEFDEYPEQAFYMIGDINDVITKNQS